MATLKDYFDTDFKHVLSVHQNQKLRSQNGQTEIEIVARTHLDFNANVKYISFYIPATAGTFDISKSLIHNPNWALATAEGKKIMSGFVGESQMSSSELTFSGRMFIYSENALPESQMAVLKQEAKQLGIAFQFRGPSYAAERTAAESSSQCIPHESGNGKESKKSLAIKPSDESQNYINAIGKLLNKTLPQDWDKARFYVKEHNNKTKWEAAYSLEDEQAGKLKETPFSLNQVFIANLDSLKDAENVRYPLSVITFHRNGKYEINYEHPKVTRLALHEIKKEIKELQALDLEKVEIDSLKKRISAITVGHKKRTPKIPIGQKLYRGIQWREKPTSVCELTYPPTSAVTKLHRAGRSGQPLFYCSTAREAVFYELGLSAGNNLVLSGWKTISPLLVNNVGYEPQAFQNLSANRLCPRWGPSSDNSELEKADKIIGEFLAKEFTENVLPGEEHLYKISIAIAEQHFQQDVFDGLMYPTIAMKGNADNFAFKPKSVDGKLVLEKVEYIRVDECSAGPQYKITLLDFANSFTEDGKIEWKSRLPHWMLRKKGDMLTVKVENGKWVARNKDGEIIEPE